MADFALHGARPWCLALEDLLLHGAMVVAVYGLGRRVLRGRRGAAPAAVAAAALFAVHPLHAESVAWLSGRKDLLSGVLEVACVCVWLDALRGRPRDFAGRYALVLVLTAAAALSKASAVSLALLLPATDLLLGPRRPLLARLLSWAPVVVGLALYARLYSGLVRTWGATHGMRVIKAFPGDPPRTIVYTDLHVLREYLRAVVVPWPDRLFAAEPYRTAFDLDVGLGLLVTLAAVLATAWLLARRRPLGFAAAWFFLGLAPFLNLTPHGIPYAERYVYLASVGPCLLAGAALAELAPRPRALGLVLAPLVLLGAWRCQRLGHAFESGRALWEHVVARAPDDAQALGSLGAWWLDHDPARAEAPLRRAVELDPGHVAAQMGLARALEAEGRLDEAAARWKVAARVRPDRVDPVYGLADLLARRGDVDEAARLYAAIVDRWPAAGARAAWNRAAVLERGGDPAAARAAWEDYLARYGRAPGEVEQAALVRARLAGGE
jgi:tetratricopeptide (TPR) repeat protein